MKYYLLMDSPVWNRKYQILSEKGHKSYVLNYSREKAMLNKIQLTYAGGTPIGEARMHKSGLAPAFDFLMKEKKEGEISRRLWPGAPKINILNGNYQVSGALKKDEYLLSSGGSQCLKAGPEEYRGQKALCIEILNTLDAEKNLLILGTVIALNHLETF